MYLPILGTTPTAIPVNFTNHNTSPSEDISTGSDETKAQNSPTGSATQGTYSSVPVSAETQSSLLALQEDPAPEASTKTANINGLSIIVSGHSVDARDGVSLLRTLSPSETKSMMAVIAAMEGDTENAGENRSPEAVQLADKIIRLDMEDALVEIASEALDALPDGATSAYMNEDFSHSQGRWNNGNPIEKSNSEDAIKEDQRTRLETLMNTVDAERKLRAEYGQDVKLVYSHTDNSYIMLTPDDANYETLKSAQSSVQDVIDEVHRGYIEKDTISDILQRYGYHI